MAATKKISSTTLVIETNQGKDKKGNDLYVKKSFSGIKTDADVQKVYAVAEAIKGVLANGAKAYYLRDTSVLAPEEA